MKGTSTRSTGGDAHRRSGPTRTMQRLQDMGKLFMLLLHLLQLDLEGKGLQVELGNLFVVQGLLRLELRIGLGRDATQLGVLAGQFGGVMGIELNGGCGGKGRDGGRDGKCVARECGLQSGHADEKARKMRVPRRTSFATWPVVHGATSGFAPSAAAGRRWTRPSTSLRLLARRGTGRRMRPARP